MVKLRNDFDVFKQQQIELNQSFIKRLHSLEAQTQNSVKSFNENNEQFAIAVVQVRNILEKHISLEDRIKRLENLNSSKKQVKIVGKCKKQGNFNIKF